MTNTETYQDYQDTILDACGLMPEQMMKTFTLAKVIEDTKANYSSVIDFTPMNGMVRLSIEDSKRFGTDVMSLVAARDFWKKLIADGYKQLGAS